MGFFPALLPTQQTQQDDNINCYSCEHPKYERTILALLDSLDDGGMFLRNVAVYQSTPKTRENAHKNEPLRQHRSVSSSLTKIPSGYFVCTILYKNLHLQLCILQYKLLRLYVYYDFKIPIPISRFEFSTSSTMHPPFL